jgi:hypothetical protein
MDGVPFDIETPYNRSTDLPLMKSTAEEPPFDTPLLFF